MQPARAVIGVKLTPTRSSSTSRTTKPVASTLTMSTLGMSLISSEHHHRIHRCHRASTDKQSSTSYASMQSNGQQEADFLKVLYPTLKRSGLKTQIACCDATGWDAQQEMLTGIQAAGQEGTLGLVTGHGYSSTEDRRQSLADGVVDFRPDQLRLVRCRQFERGLDLGEQRPESVHACQCHRPLVLVGRRQYDRQSVSAIRQRHLRS
jgi:hypothetical protein